MPDALVITPVKDSLKTTIQTIQSVFESDGHFEYVIYDDFSQEETSLFLKENTARFNYNLITLSDLTTNPSPNYKMVLQLASEKAAHMNVPLIIIESDVIIRNDTIEKLLLIAAVSDNPGMIGAITVDQQGNYNFPYHYIKEKTSTVDLTQRSISFCCTLLTVPLLKAFQFERLSSGKDWYDIHISRQSKKLGFKNYLAKNNEVIHLPHSSRPWKQLKYTHPVKYYFYKYLKNRDRI